MAHPTRKAIPFRKTTADERAILIAGLNDQPLSRLLRIAVQDMAKAKRAGRRLNMVLWVSDDGCACCMAGAVMCERVGSKYVYRFACAINEMRAGEFTTAWLTMNAPTGVPEQYRTALDAASATVRAAYNERTHRAPARVYLQVARDLEAAGL